MATPILPRCPRCGDTRVILVGGSTGPYGDDPLEEAPCPVCVTGTEEPEQREDEYPGALGCGCCHTCGAPLVARLTLALQWCPRCGATRYYRSHGWPDGDGPDTCPPHEVSP